MSAAGKITRLYRLINGDERHRADPESFTMPPHDERQRLRVGDLVKLIFEPLDDVLDGEKDWDRVRPDGGNHRPAAERMWVRITECLATIPRRYVGTLQNDPTLVPLHHGDAVAFGSEHVVDIDDRVPDGRGSVA